ncbi:hypothetical protein LSUE1_G008184 [Lachnellula suecica]|uniref:Uncharacterized protein n=1 Tax=Lachnellula suecica TaxID=602035 RepID=A0A8T9BTT0_9HELO|nr:hypothetical protein LSUE1_G008184 [Lachnellula suecica]
MSGIELRTLSLLQSFEVQESGAVCSFHPLIQDWIKFRIGKEDQRYFTNRAVIVLYEFIPGPIPESFLNLTFHQTKTLYSHMLAVRLNIERFFTEEEVLADRCEPRQVKLRNRSPFCGFEVK